MGNLLETVYDVLFHPVSAMRQIATERKLGQALAVFIFSVMFPVWAVHLGLKAAGMSNMISIVIAVHVLGSITSWIIGAAVFNLVAEFFGGRGTAVGLFTAMGYIQLPRIFFVPLWVLLSLAPSAIKPILFVVFGLAIMLWILILSFSAIKGAHELSSAKSLVVLFIPGLGIILLVAIVFILFSAALIRFPVLT